MVGGTTHQQQQLPQLAYPSSSSSIAHTTTPEEDELLKRNTDCVYFLASPLTCKKGSECEYRHSDIARVNPRDCYYWLNGNCLNPKCAFRHPPLDGLLGSDLSTALGPPAPGQQYATPYATPKQGVACIFFQKGLCLKGHLCPFLHGPSNSVNNKTTQPGPATPVTKPPQMAQVTVNRPVEFMLSQGKQPQPQSQSHPPLPTRNGVDKKITLPAHVVPPPVINEPAFNKPNRGNVYTGYLASSNERIVNGRDVEEYSREPSPGFDVLVDNEFEDSGHDYDVDLADRVDRDVYHEHRDYDHYNEQDDRFDVDHVERRPYSRNNRESGSDLRLCISNQRRGSENGVISVVNRESHTDRIPRRDSQYHHHHHHHRPDQGSFSSRLRGRIKIPGRSVSPIKENNSRVEREIDREKRHLSYQSRVRDRISDTEFARPKRLSELKSVRNEHQSNDEQFSGKRKYPKMEDLSFEGPKPLSEILKRKRLVNGSSNDDNNHDSSVNIKYSNNKETEVIPVNEEDHNSVSVDYEAENVKDKQLDVNSVSYGATELENEGEGEDEDGLIDGDALLDEELEAYDENKDGDYEYEQLDGEEDYNLDEGDYVDEEDGDEYGKNESDICA